jgi:hypothetical protein
LFSSLAFFFFEEKKKRFIAKTKKKTVTNPERTKTLFFKAWD